MNLLLDSTVKVSVIVLLGLGATALLGRQSAAVRHWVLAVALGCAAVTPLLGRVVPSWQFPAGNLLTAPNPPQPTATATVQFGLPAEASIGSDSRPQPPSKSDPVSRILGSIWIAGVLVNLGTLLIGIARLMSLTARSRRPGGMWADQAEDISRAYGLRRSVLLLHTDHPTLLVTWGTLRPKVLLPATADHWTADRVRIVVSHELAHLRRGDWVLQMVAELLRSIYWFNPLLWIACGRLRQESEYACDDLVLSLGLEPTDYAMHLVDLARTFKAHGRTWLPAPAIARPSTLQRRIRAMLNVGLNRSPLARSTRIAALIAFLCVTLPLAGLGSQVFGTVSGTIADPFGGILPNATLTLSHVESKAKLQIQSDAAGTFQFERLPAGDYLLQVWFIGFAPLQDNFTLAAGQTLEQHLTLQVGSVQETITVTEAVDPPAAGRPVARRTPSPAEGCSPSPIGGRLVSPKKLADVRPEFPPSLRNTGVRRTVLLEARIGTDGLVTEVRPVSPVDADLENAASDAVGQWRFTPTFLNCVPIELRMMVIVNFRSQQ